MANMQEKLLNLIKNNPIKLIIVGILLLNCLGFCWAEFRFLSDQERIEIAIKKELHYCKTCLKQGEAYCVVANEYPTDCKKNEYDQVPYKNLDEFFLINSNCCKVSRTVKISEGINSVTYFGCLSGNAPYFVSGRFKVRYKKDGQINIGTTSFIYRMSSCGTLFYPEITSFFDFFY